MPSLNSRAPRLQRLRQRAVAPFLRCEKAYAVRSGPREGRRSPPFPMSSSSKRLSGGGARILPPEVNRILYVRNLPFKISASELYDIFGAHGAVRQVRLGVAPATRGTAYVVYEDIYDAKAAVERLSGFNVAGRYLIVLYHQSRKMQNKASKQSAPAEASSSTPLL
ncbi:hypothetical protein I4F81_009274 [Pyropia yezoensis]|uniref:Uncharacterized protein n=1 Tax=Pyropia yezoensis TaxID=2788 RepID=A0ACC3C9D7_PYRYE|nr:hypothetical protein I4F81_009274 [Neopyropia yezoensis]